MAAIGFMSMQQQMEQAAQKNGSTTGNKPEGIFSEEINGSPLMHVISDER